jgi:hypothetical protein
MKKRVLLSFLIGALLILPLVHVGFSQSANSYSEKMKVYVAGQNAFWFLAFNGVNATNPSLSSIESQKGLDSYSISAIKFAGAVSDYQVFGNDGHGVVGLPFIPQEGLFLRISSSNGSLVNSLVGQFDIFLQSALVPISSSGNNHTFFSPVSFDAVAAPKLFRFVPSSARGFASLFTQSQFVALPTPLITLAGMRTTTGFNHRVTIGSAMSSVLDSSGNLLFSSLLRLQPNSTLSASPASNSTEVYVRTLNGLVVSSDRAKTGNSLSNFSGYYSVSVPAGKRVNANVTILSDFPVALGTRVLDHGSLSNGEFLSVTLQVQNLGSHSPIENLSVNDNWWRAFPQTFQLSTGNSSFKVPSIAPNQNFSSTYVLKVISSNKSDILIPLSWGSYGYRQKNQAFDGHVQFNQAEVRTNDVGPAVTLDVRASIRSGSPLGSNGKYLVSVRNLGNGPALNLRVLNYTQPSLAQNGGVWRFNVSMPVGALTERNLTRVFTANWQTPSGANEQISSNRVTTLFSSTGIHIPFITATATTKLALGQSPKSVNLTYSVTNGGRVNSSHITATLSLPDGMTCVRTAGGKGSCQSGQLNLNLSSISKSPTQTTFVLNLLQAKNFILMPLNLTAKYKGLTLHTYSAPVIVPGGFSVTKSFQPDALFGGMDAKVIVNTDNAGPMNIYNVTFSSPADTFDTIVGQPGRSGLYQLVEANRSFAFNYTVFTDPAQSGSLAAIPITASFVFAGTPVTYAFSQGKVSLYRPLTFSATTVPGTPVEGRPFSATLSINNSAPITVSNVRLVVPLPTGLQLLNSTAAAHLSNGALVVETPQLISNSDFKVTVSFRASGGLQVDLSKSNLTFLFQGVTVKGQSPKQTLVVSEDIYTRYAEPVVLAALVMLAAVVVIRRRVPATALSSQRETPQKQP